MIFKILGIVGGVFVVLSLFLPYVKYVTDIVDWTSGDITDALQMAGNAISGTGTFLENDVKNTPIGTKRTVGRRPGTKHTIVVDQSYKDMGNKFAKGLKVAGKAISIPGLIGDVVQSTSDIKELIEAQKRHDAVRNSVVNSRLVYKNKFNN